MFILGTVGEKKTGGRAKANEATGGAFRAYEGTNYRQLIFKLYVY